MAKEKRSEPELDSTVKMPAVPGSPGSLEALLNAGESETLEFKPGLRARDFKTNTDAKRHVELDILKSIAGFLNGRGGTLIVGVNDRGNPTGKLLEPFPGVDPAKQCDKAQQYLTDLLLANLGPLAAVQARSHFGEFDGHTVLVIECPFSVDIFPVYVSQGQAPSTRILYVRVGNTTQQFGGEDQIRYIDFVRTKHGRTSTSESPATTRASFPSDTSLPPREQKVGVVAVANWRASTERLYPQWASYREIDVRPHSVGGFEIRGKLSSASPYFRFGFKLLSLGGRIFGDGSIQSQDEPNLLARLRLRLTRHVRLGVR